MKLRDNPRQQIEPGANKLLTTTKTLLSTKLCRCFFTLTQDAICKNKTIVYCRYRNTHNLLFYSRVLLQLNNRPKFQKIRIAIGADLHQLAHLLQMFSSTMFSLVIKISYKLTFLNNACYCTLRQ